MIVARAPSGELMGFAAMDFMATHAHLILLATVVHRRQQVGSRLLSWLEDSASVAGTKTYVSLGTPRKQLGSRVL